MGSLDCTLHVYTSAVWYYLCGWCGTVHNVLHYHFTGCVSTRQHASALTPRTPTSLRQPLRRARDLARPYLGIGGGICYLHCTKDLPLHVIVLIVQYNYCTSTCIILIFLSLSLVDLYSTATVYMYEYSNSYLTVQCARNSTAVFLSYHNHIKWLG